MLARRSAWVSWLWWCFSGQSKAKGDRKARLCPGREHITWEQLRAHVQHPQGLYSAVMMQDGHPHQQSLCWSLVRAQGRFSSENIRTAAARGLGWDPAAAWWLNWSFMFMVEIVLISLDEMSIYGVWKCVLIKILLNSTRHLLGKQSNWIINSDESRCCSNDNLLLLKCIISCFTVFF